MIYHLTYKCSMGCPHCMQDAKSSGVSAGMGTTKAFVEFANSLGTKKIGVSGGEPTEHPDFMGHMEYIGEGVRTGPIILITNGQFFINDEPLLRELAEYQKICRSGFHIQVTVIPELYHQASEIASAVREYSDLFVLDTITTIEKLTVMDDLGRARNRDWAYLGDLFERQYPNCINIFTIIKSGKFNTLKEAMQYYEGHSGNFCKPAVTPFGEVRAGESIECFSMGNIHEDTHDEMFKRVWEGNPCGRCGISTDVPQAYAMGGL